MDKKIDWDVRFRQQATWSRPLREYLLKTCNAKDAKSVLEVGCGTGAILSEITGLSKTQVHGIDILADRSKKASQFVPTGLLVTGDGHALPYRSNCFDITFCHYLLLWVHSPETVLKEMKRVTHRGGFVLAMAEPDYSGRIDGPEELVEMGTYQTRSLKIQGADPGIGSKLGELFTRAGIELVETGPLMRMKQISFTEEDWTHEWSMIEYDLGFILPEARIKDFNYMHNEARKKGTRSSHVPTYYAWGRV